jgi:molybdate transport system substrate-binding protein
LYLYKSATTLPFVLRLGLALPVLLAVVVLAACGRGADDASSEDSMATVYAAASLKEVLPVALGDATYAFAGSDALALQIRQGAPADLFVAASPRYPDELAREGRCGEPVTFATNTLTLIVPADRSTGIAGVDDLLTGGPYRVAIGDPDVPIGAYTREALAAIDAEAVLTRNVVSEEPDPVSIVAKVALGSADAAIVYATDAMSAGDTVTAIPLPAGAEPTIRYRACIVTRRGANTAAARALLNRLTSPAAQAILAEAGFGPVP